MKPNLARATLLIIVLAVCLNAAADEDNAFNCDDPPGATHFKIDRKLIMKDIVGDAPRFPKYTTQLMNLANRNAQGTRPATVGRLSELIREFPGNNYEEWVKWYQEQQPEGIDEATRKVSALDDKMERALEKVDEEMIRAWVKDLVLAKTYVGLRCQESIIKQIAGRKNRSWRLADPAEESRGIDGFIGGVPVSVKPVSFQREAHLQDRIDAQIIYYEKLGDGIRVTYSF